MRTNILRLALPIIAILTACASLPATTFEITVTTPNGNDAIKRRCVVELADFILKSGHWKEFETEFDRYVKERKPDLHERSRKNWRRTYYFDCIQEGDNCRIEIDPTEKSELIITITFNTLSVHAASANAAKEGIINLILQSYKEITITRDDRIIDERELELNPGVSSNSLQSSASLALESQKR